MVGENGPKLTAGPRFSRSENGNPNSWLAAISVGGEDVEGVREAPLAFETSLPGRPSLPEETESLPGLVDDTLPTTLGNRDVEPGEGGAAPIPIRDV
jgi:hypothetical protein